MATKIVLSIRIYVFGTIIFEEKDFLMKRTFQLPIANIDIILIETLDSFLINWYIATKLRKWKYSNIVREWQRNFVKLSFKIKYKNCLPFTLQNVPAFLSPISFLYEQKLFSYSLFSYSLIVNYTFPRCLVLNYEYGTYHRKIVLGNVPTFN